MSKDHLLELTLFSERAIDMEFMATAMKSFDAISGFIKSLNQDVKEFNRVFSKTKEGYFFAFSLEKRLPEIPEHKDLYLSFEDREIFGHSASETVAYVDMQLTSQGNIDKQRIMFVIDVPEESKKSAKAYNFWFSKNLYSFFRTKRYYYVHEFTHVIDQRNLKQTFRTVYNAIAKKKLSIDELENEVTTLEKRLKAYKGKDKTELTQELDGLKNELQKGKEELKKSYFNAPLETNAFFRQTLSWFIQNAKKQAKNNGIGGVKGIIGSNPQEFADKFVDRWNIQYPTAPLSDKLIKNFIKRASTIYYEILAGFANI